MLLFALFIELIGVSFCWIGLRHLLTARARGRTWLTVEGSVTGLRKSRSVSRNGRAITVYAPFYRYVIEGTKHVGVSDIASSRPRYRVGDPIRLLVDPANPGESTVVDFGTWLFSWGIILAGLLPMAMGALIAVDTLFGKRN